jgi:hypothetical protein
VIGHAEDFMPSISFAVVVSGNIEMSSLGFNETADCTGSCSPEKWSSKGLCECPPREFIGENYQVPVLKISPKHEATSIAIHGLSNGYLAFQRPTVPGNLTVNISMVSEWDIHAFIREGNSSALPRDYESAVFDSLNWTLSISSEESDSSVIGVMLRNNAPGPAVYNLSSERKRFGLMNEPESGLSGGEITGIVIGCIFFVVIITIIVIVIVVVIVLGAKSKKKSQALMRENM